MIDWNLEEEKVIKAKQQKRTDYETKLEAERQKKIAQQLQLEKNIPIFDQVIIEEIENLKAYVNKYADLDVTIEKGHVHLFRCAERGRHNWGSPSDIYCTSSSTEDVAEWTRKILIAYAMQYTINYK